MKAADFAQRWVLITGASSGLGAEFARQLAHRGANLILTARSQERLNTFASDLRQVNGVRVEVVPADLSTSEGVSELLRAVDALNVELDHVINNAGFGSIGQFAEADAEQHAAMVRVNVEAVMRVARHFFPALVRRGRGGVIQLASTAAFQPTPLMATYGATKAFVLSFSLALSEEARGTGVRVLTVCPGPVPTGFQEAAGFSASQLPKLATLNATKVVEEALAAYDAGRSLVVPGVVNSLQTSAVRFLPRGVVLKAARWAMKSLGRG